MIQIAISEQVVGSMVKNGVHHDLKDGKWLLNGSLVISFGTGPLVCFGDGLVVLDEILHFYLDGVHHVSHCPFGVAGIHSIAHGILLERKREPLEPIESGLPTLFTISDVFQEPQPVVTGNGPFLIKHGSLVYVSDDFLVSHNGNTLYVFAMKSTIETDIVLDQEIPRDSPLFFLTAQTTSPLGLSLVTQLPFASDDLIVVITRNHQGQDVLFLLDRLKDQLGVYSLPDLNPIFSIKAKQIVGVNATRSCQDILILLPNGQVELWIGFNERILVELVDSNVSSLKRRFPCDLDEPTLLNPLTISHLLKSCDSRVSIELDDKRVKTADFDLNPKSTLVSKLLEALLHSLDLEEYQKIKIQWLYSHFGGDSVDEFTSLLKVLSSLKTRQDHLESPFEWLTSQYLPKMGPIVFSFRFKTMTCKPFGKPMGDHHMYYKINLDVQFLFEESLVTGASKDDLDRLGSYGIYLSTLCRMPKFVDYYWRRGYFCSSTTPLEGAFECFDHPYSLHEFVMHVFKGTPNEIKMPPSRFPSLCRLHGALFRSLVSHQSAIHLNLSIEDRNSLPLGLSVLLRQLYYLDRDSLHADASPSFLEALGRTDVIEQADPVPRRGISKDSSSSSSELLAQISKETLNLKTQDLATLLYLRFGRDDRVLKVFEVLTHSNVDALAGAAIDDTLSSDEMALAQQTLLLNRANRVLAQPLGASIFLADTCYILPTEKVQVPNVQVSARLPPVNSIVSLQPGPTSKILEWPEFHTGVVEGLKVKRDAVDIDSSWIVFNQSVVKDEPATVDPKHAGFVFGLGLAGHLQKLEFADSLRYYLLPQNEFLSIGLLLGLSVSYYGTGHSSITQMLSVHIPSMLPSNSNELVTGEGTKAAAVLGYGLVHAGSRNRSRIDSLVNELKRIRPSSLQSEQSSFETYALACGFSLGFLTDGEDNDTKVEWNTKDEELATQLNDLTKSKYAHIVGPAATVALGLCYMMTNNESVAAKFNIPTNAYMLEFVKPQMLTLNVICKYLVLWDSIQPSVEWISSQIPEFMRSAADHLESDELHVQSYYAFMAGLAQAIGLRFAGTFYKPACDTLISLLESLIKQVSNPAVSYKEVQIKGSKKSCLCIIATSLAMVMAGTGNAHVFDLFKTCLEFKVTEFTYGHQVAFHSAIGTLFMGGGLTTLARSKTAVTALLCAFYPLFLGKPSDQNGHLPAFRHLWVLASEKRSLLTFDVETRGPISVPVKLFLSNNQVIESVTPCLLPETNLVQKIEIQGPRYASASYSLKQTIKKGVQGHFIWVKRNLGYLPYSEDKLGQRSIHTLTLPHLSKDSYGVQAVASDPQILALLQSLCLIDSDNQKDHDVSLYGTSIVHQCLTFDKSYMIESYLSLYQFGSRFASRSVNVWSLMDIQLLVGFYEYLTKRRSKMERLIETDLLDNLDLLIEKSFTGLDPGQRIQLQGYLKLGPAYSVDPFVRCYIVQQQWPNWLMLQQMSVEFSRLKTVQVDPSIKDLYILFKLSEKFRLPIKTLKSIVECFE